MDLIVKCHDGSSPSVTASREPHANRQGPPRHEQYTAARPGHDGQRPSQLRPAAARRCASGPPSTRVNAALKQLREPVLRDADAIIRAEQIAAFDAHKRASLSANGIGS